LRQARWLGSAKTFLRDWQGLRRSQHRIRLVDAEAEQKWAHRGHFVAAAAEAMRRILVEEARRKQRVKHGGGQHRVELDASA
jgi:hypothetical protein